jgi:molecular chaperone DnaK (HSP70)
VTFDAVVSSKFLQLIREQENLTFIIEASSGLTSEEIRKNEKDAEANTDADKITRERAEKLNEADGMIFQTETQLKDLGAKSEK